MRRRERRKSGLTLLECLLATALIALVAAVIAQALAAGEMQTYESLRNARADMLAEALMEEIVALPYADPGGMTTAGPGPGETNRWVYDNAADFHGYTEAAGNVRDAFNQFYPPEYQEFSRSVTAVYNTLSVPGFSAATTGLTITVTVTDRRGATWVVTRFVTP